MINARGSLDLSVYLVIGPGMTLGRTVHDVVLSAVAGGVTVVQLRWKDGPTGAFVEMARVLVAALSPLDVPLLVNDRVDVALAAGARGVHVGQDDMSPADARRLLGPDAIIGLSITTLEEARAMNPAIVDYAGIGPVFPTPSKLDAAAPLGLAGVRDVRAAIMTPAVAIGGITCDNASEVMTTGVDGVAVISAVCGADDPRGAAERLTASLGGVRRRTPATAG